MNTGEITEKWVITKKLGLYKNSIKVPVTLYCHYIIIIFFFYKND